MALPYTIPLKATFKKEYNFLWYLSPDIQIKEQPFVDKTYVEYISQLAQTVALPDDEFDTETLEYGPMTIKFPSKVVMNDIEVTYLEDSLDSVYNFHKSWFNLLKHYGGINSPYIYRVSGTYMGFDKTLTASEFMLFKNVAAQYLSSMISSVISPGLVQSQLFKDLDYMTKVSTTNIYPRIYPIKISRSQANKQGDSFGTTSVTYARLPKVLKTKYNPKELLKDVGLKGVASSVSGILS